MAGGAYFLKIETRFCRRALSWGKDIKLLIFHIAGAYGGAERTTINLVTHLDRNIVLAASRYIYDHVGAAENVRIVQLDQHGFRGWFGGVPSLVADVIRAYRLIRRESPDIVLSVMHYAATLAVFARLVPGMHFTAVSSLRGPVYEHLRYYERGMLRGRFVSFLVTAMARLSDRILVPSEGTKKELEQHTKANGAKIRVIHNSIDIDRVDARRRAPLEEAWIFSDPECPVLCAAARLVPEKDVAFLMRVFARVREKMPCRFVVLGDGPERSMLEGMTKDLGVDDSVIFLGHRENVFPYIGRSHIFLHSCVYEGSPNSILEAMACGTPVVATDCPYGPREIIGDDQYGLLCRMHDESDMTEKLLLLMTDKDVRARYIELGKQRVGDFSTAKMVEGYDQALTSL